MSKLSGRGYDVVCPGCSGIFHETTAFFDSTKTPHGGMFRLKARYGPDGYNWSSFFEHPDTPHGELECPECGAPYCGSGTTVTVTKSPEAHVCAGCGSIFPTAAKLNSHARVCPYCKPTEKVDELKAILNGKPKRGRPKKGSR